MCVPFLKALVVSIPSMRPVFFLSRFQSPVLLLETGAENLVADESRWRSATLAVR